MKNNKHYIRTYSELCTLKTWEERFEYLKLSGIVGEDTFGFDRYLNQRFYRSKEWKDLRNKIIARDMGCDLGMPGYDILYDKVIVHHMNPIVPKDIVDATEYLLNPNFLITVSIDTHNAIHYGTENKPKVYEERHANDTCPWKY